MKLLRRKPRATAAAIAAHKRAEDALARTRSQTPIFRALANDLREIQKRNHLAEAFEHALRGGTP